MPAPARDLAGFPAVWTDLEIFVEDETSGEGATSRVGLYTIAEPEKWIDSQALLRERVIADPPYWAIVWTGARAIASTLARGPSLSGVRVLDLGCGLGLSGLAAAMRGASVLFADYLEQPLEFVRATVASAALPHCQAARVDFTRDHLDGHFDLILAADIVYDPAHYAPLADFLTRHLAEGGRILLTESLRADARAFLEGMTARGFHDNRAALWVREDGRRERTWLHELS